METVKKFKQNSKKLKELILYISTSYEDVEYYGKTKLNKTLFAIDFDSFYKNGKPITGAKYKKADNGPVPFSIVPITLEMESDNEIEIREEKIGSYPQKRIIPLRQPNLEEFSKKEMTIIDKWIDIFRNERAISLSRWSHRLSVWKFSNDDGFIPYNRIYWKFPQTSAITEKDKEIVRNIMKRTGNKPTPRPA